MTERETLREVIAAGHELADAAEAKIIDLEVGLRELERIARQQNVRWNVDTSPAAPRLRAAIADFRRVAAAPVHVTVLRAPR